MKATLNGTTVNYGATDVNGNYTADITIMVGIDTQPTWAQPIVLPTISISSSLSVSDADALILKTVTDYIATLNS